MKIRSLHESEEREVLWTLIEKFPTLKNILARHGVDLGQLHCIGGTTKGTGCQGQAYSDGNIVVKVTEDKQEAQASAAVVNRGGVKGVARIHYVGKISTPIKWPHGLWADFPDGPGPQYYIIIQELLDTNIGPIAKQVSTIIGNWMVENNNADKLFDALSRVPESQSEATCKAVTRIIFPEAPNEVINIATEILEAVARLYYDAGVRFIDIQPGNLGRTSDGEYHLFDLGISQTQRTYAHTSIESIEFKPAGAQLLKD